MIFYQLFESQSCTYTYILADSVNHEALIIDPVLEMVDRDLQLISDLNLKLKWVVETHVHADHITGAHQIKKKTGALTVLSRVSGVTCADRLIVDGDLIQFGKYNLRALETPGHTNGCMSYYIEGKVFTGDSLLVRATGRTDFQEGDSRKLYHSIHSQLFSLPPETEVYPGHNYEGIGKSTIDQEMRLNPRIGCHKSLEEFVTIMAQLKLAYPKKIDIALPANLRCGETHV